MAKKEKESRTRVLAIRVTDKMKKEVDRRAAMAEMTTSDFLEDLLKKIIV